MSDEREQGDDITRFIGGNDETRFTGVGAPPAAPAARPESTIAPGSLLGHTYRIEAMLARGGMGEVYRARHGELNTEHALKIILPELASNTRIVDLFRREASMLRTVRHDAVVAYDGIFRDENGRLYLVMEFVDGPSLSKLMRERTLGADEIRQLRDRLADGLAVAHDKGVIHRDISPDNVILPGGDLGQAKIIDFGISKAADPEVKTIIGDDFAGKYAYVSPEQLGMFGGKVDGRSDIYSLGLVLVAAALGEPLDMGQSPIAVIEARRTVPDLSRVPEGVRADLAAMLQPDPANRPQSMRELVRPSERRQERRSVLSEEASEPAPAQRSSRSLQIAGAVAVVVLLAGGAGYWFVGRGGDDKSDTAQGTATTTQQAVATTASDGGAAAIEGAGQSEGSTAASGSNAGASGTTATQQETATADTTTSSSVASNEAVTPTADSAATTDGGAPSESSAASDTATATQQATVATDATTAATDATTAATAASNDTATVAGDSQAQSGADSVTPAVTFVDPTAGAAPIGTSVKPTVSSAAASSETDASAGQASTTGATEADSGAADQAQMTTAATEQSMATGGALDAASSEATPTTDNGALAVATDAASTAGGGTDVGDTQVALGPNLGKLREDARRAVESLSCAGVRADVTDAGEILASGYVASEADRNKALARLAVVPNAGRVDNSIAIMAPPLCDVLDVLRADTAFDQGAPALDPGGAAGIYREGDHIKVAVTPPAGFEGYLYVDYFDAKERYVIHLVPNSNFRSENRVRAGETMVIGTLPKEYDTYQIKPPFGDNVIVAVVSRQPLFDGMRPIQESIDAYLPALRSSLKQAAGADVASAYAGVELKPR